jgi:hypothetical protein
MLTSMPEAKIIRINSLHLKELKIEIMEVQKLNTNLIKGKIQSYNNTIIESTA